MNRNFLSKSFMVMLLVLTSSQLVACQRLVKATKLCNKIPDMECEWEKINEPHRRPLQQPSPSSLAQQAAHNQPAMVKKQNLRNKVNDLDYYSRRVLNAYELVRQPSYSNNSGAPVGNYNNGRVAPNSSAMRRTPTPASLRGRTNYNSSSSSASIEAQLREHRALEKQIEQGGTSNVGFY